MFFGVPSNVLSVGGALERTRPIMEHSG